MMVKTQNKALTCMQNTRQGRTKEKKEVAKMAFATLKITNNYKINFKKKLVKKCRINKHIKNIHAKYQNTVYTRDEFTHSNCCLNSEKTFFLMVCP